MKISKEFYQDPKKSNRFHHRKSRYEFICMEYALSNATAVDGTNVMWAVVLAQKVPGSYIVRLMKTKLLLQKPVEIKLDPRVTTMLI
jgi:hypothetical protein